MTMRRPSADAVAIASMVPGCHPYGFIWEMSLKKLARFPMSRNVPDVDAKYVLAKCSRNSFATTYPAPGNHET